MKIGYSKTYPIIGKEQWEKIWIEDEVTGTEEDARKALYALKRQVESFHYESNKAAEKDEVKAAEPKYSGASLISDIKSCSDIKVLKSYEIIVKNKPELQATYDQQLKKLQNETGL